MLRHIPRPRREETLYSVLARYGGYLGDVDAAPFMAALLGRRHAIASPTLPGGLASFVAELDVERRESAIDVLIDGLTLFPFYTAFVPQGLRRETRSAMRGDMTGVHTRLGLACFRVQSPDALRFCPDCLDEMEAAHRDPWWRRDHQMPGVPVCPDHGTALRLSAVRLGGVGRHRFVAASRVVCRADSKPAVAAGSEDMDRLHQLAKAAAGILVAPPPALEFAALSNGYRERLDEVGLMRSACKVDLMGLHDAFVSHWAGVPDLIGLDVGSNLDRSWLAAMVRKGRRAAHPIQHLLMRELLNDLTAVRPPRPFGYGPWECRNPLVDHQGRMVVEDLDIRRDRAKSYGYFSCSCGYVYARTLSADGEIRAPRYRSFGKLLAPALVEAVARGDGLRVTARKLRLDPKTLMREAKIAKVAVPWTMKPSGRMPELRPAKVAERKKREPRLCSHARRNWFAIDTRLARSARQASHQILGQSPPARVTFAAVEARIARRDWILKRRANLPQTLEAISNAAECVADFRIRRLRWCAVRAVSAGEHRPSEVMRMAGLPTGWLEIARDEVGRALSRRIEAA